MEEHVVPILIDYRGRHTKGIFIFSAFDIKPQQQLQI
jgi:hypothetical protein